MLKGLLTKIKSQKASTSKDNTQKQAIQRNFNYKAIENLQQKQNSLSNTKNICITKSQNQLLILGQQLSSQASSQLNHLNCGIKSIRYWHNSNIPEIFAKVMACPISHFNLLSYSKRKVKQIDLLKHPFPQYLNFMKPLLEKQLPTYNHILINHYPKGIGIMHHFDGPLYKDRVIVLSLGGPVLISFVQDYSKKINGGRLLLEDRSIHIFQNDAYTRYLHGIQDQKYDSIVFKIRKKYCTQYQQKAILNKDSNNNLLQGNLKDLNNKSQIQDDYNSYQITQCSVSNFLNTQTIKNLIKKYLSQLLFNQEQNSIKAQQQKYHIQFNQKPIQNSFLILKGCLVYIKEQNQSNKKDQNNKNNKQYKWKLQIQRQERISITIRQKYQSST